MHLGLGVCVKKEAVVSFLVLTKLTFSSRADEYLGTYLRDCILTSW